MTEVPLL
jgi:hypothetical protein